MTVWVVITDAPWAVYMRVSEEVGDGEGTDSDALSLLSYTLRYVSLTDLYRLCQVGL
jgi:hypothetical protein